MRAEAKMLIEKYGKSITITPSENATVICTKAFIQPLRCDEQSELYNDYVTSEGIDQFLYIGLPGTKLETYPQTTIITSDSKNYKIIKAESVYLFDKVVYERAVLEETT